MIIQSLVKKFGKNAVYTVVNSEAGGEINNVLSYVVEVGSIAYMSNISIIIDDNSLLDRCYSTVFLMNVALARALKNLALLEVNNGGYYNGDAITMISERVYNLAKIHIGYPNLPEELRNDTFSTDELFSFYLGDYLA